jgi:putative membrane protein
MFDLLLLILFCIFGVFVGVLTGLLPGLHVNNIALILLSLSGSIVALSSPLLGLGLSETFILLLIASFIVGTSVSHTFHDIIPTTFIGAPDEDTALSVLPGHKLLLKGKGYDVIALSAMGSYGAILVCFLIFFLIRLILGSPFFLYSSLQEIMGFFLIAIALLMLATEKAHIPDFGTKGKRPAISGMLFAAFVFFFSGIFGLIILSLPMESPLGWAAPVLFPALSGLFGMPALIQSLMTKPIIPEQKISQIQLNPADKKESIISVITGGFAGILVSIIPGITSATGTILAMTARRKSSDEQTIITLSAVNTASAFSVILVLFIILRPRSGAALAVNELIPVSEWSGILMPQELVYLLIVLLIGGTVSYFLAVRIGAIFARSFVKFPYEKIVFSTICLIIGLVFLFTGVMGLLVLCVATCLGALPILWGVRRSHCMGVLLIPIILQFLL